MMFIPYHTHTYIYHQMYVPIGSLTRGSLRKFRTGASRLVLFDAFWTTRRNNETDHVASPNSAYATMTMIHSQPWKRLATIFALWSFGWPTVVSFSFQHRKRLSHSASSGTVLFEGDKKKNLSASEKEQRDEEARRRQRKDDVVIGKTSAKKGEKDFALDPKGTEQEYLRQASRIDREVYFLTEEGMQSLNAVRQVYSSHYLSRLSSPY
jgi:hypothetical protein